MGPKTCLRHVSRSVCSEGFDYTLCPKERHKRKGQSIVTALYRFLTLTIVLGRTCKSERSYNISLIPLQRVNGGPIWVAGLQCSLNLKP